MANDGFSFVFFVGMLLECEVFKHFPFETCPCQLKLARPLAMLSVANYLKYLSGNVEKLDLYGFV